MNECEQLPLELAAQHGITTSETIKKLEEDHTGNKFTMQLLYTKGNFKEVQTNTIGKIEKLKTEKEKNLQDQVFALQMQKQINHHVQALKNQQKDQEEHEEALLGVYKEGVRFAINLKAAEYPEHQAKCAPTDRLP